jgi:predicted CXXCH cytochrome family protein
LFGAANAADHPTLPNLDRVDCSVCHDDLVEGMTTVHEPVADDCTMCHEFSRDDSGTTVELADAEPALCLMCHDDLEQAASLELAVPHMPVEDSCLNCHEAHAAKTEHLLLETITGVCANCHDVDELNEVHGGQLTAATDCASCHQPHGSEHAKMLIAAEQHVPFADGSCSGCHREPFGERIRLRARGERLCAGCHGDLAADAGETGTVHAPLRGERGRAGCLSCHDPHMSPNRTLLIERGVALCGECHAEVVEAAAAETGHAAAADDCLTCHQPHTAERAHLLSEPKDELCSMCPDTGDEDLVASHLGADLATLDCTSCHSPHGAGNEKLLAQTLHPVVLDGCDTCHEGAFNELMEGGEAELCLMCHDDPAETAEVPHDAMAMGSCTICHNPHASPQRKLVKHPGGAACGECHDDQIAGPDEVAHGIIDLIGCEVCHEPHGASNEKLLRQTGAELCLDCHGPGGVRIDEEQEVAELLGRYSVPAESARAISTLRLSADGQSDHPVTNHRVLGTPSAKELKRTDTSFEGELSCLTCHNPHKGKSAGLFQWGAASPMEACQACHQK